MGTRASAEVADPGSIQSVGRQGIDHVNESGRKFHSYLEMNNLVALTTYFRKKNYGTWMYPRSNPYTKSITLSQLRTVFIVSMMLGSPLYSLTVTIVLFDVG